MDKTASSSRLEAQKLKFQTLKNAFSGGPYVAVQPYSRKNKAKFSFYSLLHTSLFPSVYANEVENSDEFKKEKTSLDRIALARPMIVVTDQEVKDYITKETGMDRLKIMYEYTDTGATSAEIDFILKSMKSAFMVTFIIASVLGSRAGREKAIRKQQHQKFDHQIKALRRINDASLIGGFKLGLSYGLKMTLFVGIFGLTSQSIATYRNKTGIIEYIAAGAVTGSLAKISLGPKGMVGGAFVGSTLGLFGGVMIMFMVKSANETFEQRHYWYTNQKLKEKKEVQELSQENPVSSSSSESKQAL